MELMCSNFRIYRSLLFKTFDYSNASITFRLLHDYPFNVLFSRLMLLFTLHLVALLTISFFQHVLCFLVQYKSKIYCISIGLVIISNQTIKRVNKTGEVVKINNFPSLGLLGLSSIPVLTYAFKVVFKDYITYFIVQRKNKLLIDDLSCLARHVCPTPLLFAYFVFARFFQILSKVYSAPRIFKRQSFEA